MSDPVPTREEYLAKPEIQAVLDKRPEIKAFIDKHPFIILGRAAYEAESKTVSEREDDEVFEYESKPFPEMVLVQMYRYSTRPDANPDLQNRRLFAAAVINDEHIEKRFQNSAKGPADGNQYGDPDGCLLEVWKGK